MYFAANKKFKAFSIAGSVLITVFFVLVNYITSPGYPWFIYPTFAVWWWPMAMYIAGAKKYKLFSVTASIYTIAFFLTVNLVSSPKVMWFIYPAFAIVWWPMSQIICGAKKYRLYSVVASLYFIGFLALVNYLTSPGYMWFYYPAYAVAWWPLSMFLLKKNLYRAYSLIMTLATVAYLAIINLLNTPDYMWFQYTIFYLLWWPWVMFMGKKAKSLGFSIVGAALIIAYHTAVYYIETPLAHPWYLYIILPAVWWPVCTALKRHMHKIWFLLMSLIVFVGILLYAQPDTHPGIFLGGAYHLSRAVGRDGHVFWQKKELLRVFGVGVSHHHSILFAGKLHDHAKSYMGDIPFIRDNMVATELIFLQGAEKRQ